MSGFLSAGLFDAIPDEALYYFEGDENEDLTGGWIETYTEESFSTSKNDDNLETIAIDGNGRATFGTDLAVDLSDVNTLRVEWECPQVAETSGDARMILNAMDDPNVGEVAGDALLLIDNIDAPRERQEDTLDVSDISGEKRLRVGAWHGSSDVSGTTEVKTYQIGIAD